MTVRTEPGESSPFKKATEDIVCVKALERVRVEGTGQEMVVTPYRFAEITADMRAGRTLMTPAPCESEMEKPKAITPTETEINGGWLHSYAATDPTRLACAVFDEIWFLADEIGHRENFMECCGGNPEIVASEIWLCVIPAGSEYGAVETWDGFPGYASSALRYVRMLADMKEPLQEEQIVDMTKKIVSEATGADPGEWDTENMCFAKPEDEIRVKP